MYYTNTMSYVLCLGKLLAEGWGYAIHIIQKSKNLGCVKLLAEGWGYEHKILKKPKQEHEIRDCWIKTNWIYIVSRKQMTLKIIYIVVLNI